ncbi:MAG: glycosyltransferase family 2 protein [Acidobacteriota bacterium]
MSRPEPDRIAALVLAFGPDDATLRKMIVSLCQQVEHILIIDNGSGWSADALLASLSDDERARITCLRLASNLGLGGGHNRGIAWARDRGFTHVLLLDHDSIPRPDMVRHLSTALARLQAAHLKVSAVGPRRVDSYGGSMSGFVRLGWLKLQQVFCDAAQPDHTLETDLLITSGALIPMDVLAEVGGMNEAFFIDHVDDEWIFRAKFRGYRSFGVCNALMEHSLGGGTLRFWLGRWRHVPIHSPERNYYVFRNSFVLFRMPHATWRWVYNDLERLLFMAIVYPIFTPHRLRRLRMMARGVWDGLRGVTGPLA